MWRQSVNHSLSLRWAWKTAPWEFQTKLLHYFFTSNNKSNLHFTWTDNGTTHRSPMNPTVEKRIDFQVARQELKTQTGSTANFLIREDNSRDLLGKLHNDRSVWIRARRRVLQCLSYQFPCALQLQTWSILKDVKCRLCEKNYKEKKMRDPPDSFESVGHIQYYCPVLQLPSKTLQIENSKVHLGT